MFLLPEVVQSDALHCAVVTKLATKHFPEHGDEVNMMLCVHCIVVVEVQKHYLNQSNTKVVPIKSIS